MPGTETFDLALAKLRRPVLRPGTVQRSALLERLTGDDRRSVASVVAPAGYGKTTLLSMWAERDDRPFAWVSIDDRDNDAKVLLTYVAEALNRVEPVGTRVFEALRSRSSSVPGSVVPRLGAALTAMKPVVLVLDDVHLLHNSECRASLSVLAEQVPAGSQMVFAGRAAPPIRAARLRAEGRITEVGTVELSMTRDETAALLSAAETTLDADDITTLHERAEGWPVGLYLAALYLREGGSVTHAAVSFSGGDRLVSEYMESEFLERIPAVQRAFLTRSAALAQMSGALCEAALDLPEAARTLADLAESNLLLVPLDRRGQWYRYHHLFGDMLRAELERREPQMMSDVRRRAARWYLANNQPEEALEYAMLTGDADTVGRLVRQLWLDVLWSSRTDTLERWIRWMDERDAVRAHPIVAASASFLYAVTDRHAEAVRWAELLDRWRHEPEWSEDPVTEGYIAVLRVLHPRHGVAQMRADLDEATAKFAVAGASTPHLDIHRGLVCVLEGDDRRADAYFEAVCIAAEESDAQEIEIQALYQRSLIAMRRADWDASRNLADRIRRAYRRPGVEEAFVWTVRARIAAHDHDLSSARDALANMQRLRPLTVNPHLAVQLRIELARVYLTLADLSGARTMMREVDEILEQSPDLGTLVDAAADLKSTLSKERGPVAVGPSALTTAELRLLPMLCTHLTTPEIAEELFVSRHTIRSQTQAIYRKLNVSNRHEAVTRARELQLVE